MEKRFIYQSLFIICTLGSIICDDGTQLKHLFTYDGSGDANFSCNGSDVINITDIQLINHTTDCSRNTCYLTDNDKNHIEMCNSNSLCEIPIEDLSPCIMERGFYSVNYSCQGTASNCDFGNGLCGWNTAGSRWEIVQNVDDPYLFVQTNKNEKISSKIIARNKNQCISFFYYIKSEDAYIKLYKRYLNNKIQEKEIRGASDGTYWDQFRMSIRDAGDYTIEIETMVPHGWSEFEIDDIKITNTYCDESSDLEQIPHNQECNYVDDKILLDGCYSDYLSMSTVRFDPLNDNCEDNSPKNATSVCWDSDHVTYCEAKMFVSQHPTCLNLNTLRLEYTCTEPTADQTTTTTTTTTVNDSDKSETTTDQTSTTTNTIYESDKAVTTNEKKITTTNKPTVSETGTTHGYTGSRITNESDGTGMVVGFIIGGLLVIGLICTVAFVVYRRRNGYQKGKTEKGNNNLSASWHVDGQGAYVNSVQLSTKTLPTGNVIGNNLATNNPSYEQGYIVSLANISVKKDESEYINMPKQTALTGGNNTTSEYNVLDPKETGFSRTNGNTYELASPTNENSDDEYAESGVGVYYISGNSRHKVKDPIYDHSVDDTYDTSNRGRQEDLGDYTYNHVFGKQTEDDYDIAGS